MSKGTSHFFPLWHMWNDVMDNKNFMDYQSQLNSTAVWEIQGVRMNEEVAPRSSSRNQGSSAKQHWNSASTKRWVLLSNLLRSAKYAPFKVNFKIWQQCTQFSCLTNNLFVLIQQIYPERYLGTFLSVHLETQFLKENRKFTSFFWRFFKATFSTKFSFNSYLLKLLIECILSTLSHTLTVWCEHFPAYHHFYLLLRLL